MEQPNKILASGTRVVTHAELEPTTGMNVPQPNIGARRRSTTGKILAAVVGHGGDVYWIWHEGAELMAPYCFTEFELEEGPQQGAAPRP
jgi:hypothetical protein